MDISRTQKKLLVLISLIINIPPSNASEKVRETRWPIPKEIQLKEASPKRVYEIAVIGAGAAGTMAAKKSVLNNDDVLFIIGDRKSENKSRGVWAPKFSNLPAFTKITRPVISIRNETLEDISKSPQREKLSVLRKSIKHISKINKKGIEYFILTDSTGSQYQAKYVILATGIMDIQPLIKGEIPILSYANRQEAIYCLLCDGHLSFDKKNVVIMGHSDAAASNAILLAERYALPKITILTNGKKPNWSFKTAKLLNLYRIFVNENNIKIISDEELKKLTSITFEDESSIKVDLILVSLGFRINNDLAKQLDAKLDSQGYVIGNADGLTSVKNLYVAGDLKSGTRKQVYIAWDTALRASEKINSIIRMNRRENLLKSSGVIQ